MVNPPPAGVIESHATSANAATHWALSWSPAQWPGQGDVLTWCQDMGPATATVLVMAGLVYLLFGFYLFKILVTLNAALLGAWVGAVAGTIIRANFGDRAGWLPAWALLGAFTAGVVAWPLMKYAVALMGGLYGAVLGASIWRAVGLEPGFAWAGAFAGLIGFGMLSFILFRGSVIMYTSLQGSVMLVFGILGLIYKYQSLAPQVNENIQLRPFLLPMAIFIPAMFGLIYQQMQRPPQVAAAGGGKK